MDRIHRTRRVLMAAATICLLTVPAAAQERQTVSETRPASANARVVIENLAGQITIVGWDRREVSVEGTLHHEISLEITGEGDHVRIAVRWPENERSWRGRGRDRAADLTLRVPHAGRISANTVSADLDASDLRGEVSLESVSGSIELRGGAPERVRAKSVSGGIEILAPALRTEAQTVSGDLLLRGPGGEAEVSTVSGGIQVEQGRFAQLELTSVSGRIRFDGDLDRTGRLEVSNHSGSIELRLPANIGAEVQMGTFSGSIHSEFGGEPEGKGRFATGRTLNLKLGDGGARVDVDSFSGSVRLSKR